MVKVIKLFLGKERASKLEDLILKFPDANFFFDEAPIGGPDGISPEDLKGFAKNLSRQNVFWIACHQNHPKKEDLQPGTCLNCRAIALRQIL